MLQMENKNYEVQLYYSITRWSSSSFSLERWKKNAYAKKGKKHKDVKKLSKIWNCL
jgi:hypothetical protein